MTTRCPYCSHDQFIDASTTNPEVVCGVCKQTFQLIRGLPAPPCSTDSFRLPVGDIEYAGDPESSFLGLLYLTSAIVVLVVVVLGLALLIRSRTDHGGLEISQQTAVTGRLTEPSQNTTGPDGSTESNTEKQGKAGKIKLTSVRLDAFSLKSATVGAAGGNQTTPRNDDTIGDYPSIRALSFDEVWQRARAVCGIHVPENTIGMQVAFILVCDGELVLLSANETASSESYIATLRSLLCDSFTRPKLRETPMITPYAARNAIRNWGKDRHASYRRQLVELMREKNEIDSVIQELGLTRTLDALKENDDGLPPYSQYVKTLRALRINGPSDEDQLGLFIANQLASQKESYESSSASGAKLGVGTLVWKRGMRHLFPYTWNGRIVKVDGDEYQVEITYATDDSPYIARTAYPMLRSDFKVRTRKSLGEIWNGF